ncbi:MAG: ABC transporter permease subunit [Bdellovibrionales bacterium]|nr:ABC transporter permease subunit [Bdellovibrionales bacterium]
MKNIANVTKYTFLEVYRSKLMVSLLFLALGLILVTYVASEFAYGAPAKIALDVGLGIMSLSNLIISIFIGATLLSREIEQRTLYMVLSRPISRVSFLIGKILGLSMILLINSILLGSLTIFLFTYFGGNFQTLFVWTLYFAFLEAFTVLIFAIFFSLITNTTLSVVYTIIIFIIGHALNETSKILLVKLSPLFRNILEASFLILPNFYRLNLKDFVLYEQNITLRYLSLTHIYLVLYLVALISLVSVIFKNKNLD